MPRLRGPHRGHPTLPGIKGMPVLALVFDTIPELGATKICSTIPYPFLHLRERFETLAIVVIFSPFWAGKFDGHAKIPCVVLHHCHGVSPTI
jgi:hypothetical protein